MTDINTVTRAEISRWVNGDERSIRALESLFASINFLSSQITQLNSEITEIKDFLGI